MSASHVGSRIRVRIAAIELQPATSKRVIKGELCIDGKVAIELPPIDIGQPLKWTKLITCDVSPKSCIGLALHERQLRVYSRNVSESFPVSELTQAQINSKQLLINVNNAQYNAEIKILDQARVDELFTQGRKKLTEMEQVGSTPERLKTAQRVFKTMLEFGNVVADAHPIAKMVFAICTCAWERLEAQQKSSDDLDRLAGRLIGMGLLVEEVKKYARLDSLLQNIEEFLYLIEDVSIFAMDRDTKGSVARLLQGLVDSSSRDRVGELGDRFEKISSDFSAAISVQTMVVVTTAREEELLKRLNHVEPSGHDPSQACQEGTRLGVLNDIDTWIHSIAPASGPPLMWVYGQAGMGKSTISASICNRLAEKGTPAVSFFCKRDDPARRDPLRLISSIAYGLACRCPPFGKAVAAAIATDPELCSAHLGVRFEGLLKKPLSELQNSNTHPLSSCIVLVDALDECGTTETRKQLLGNLRGLSFLVPWLRVIITSRPDSDIRSFFDQCPTNAFLQTPLHDYPATGDIRAFIEARLSSIDMDDEWPVDSVDRLCTKAGELFIWAATACKLIASALDPLDQLQQLADESSSGHELGDLDSLYMTVIRNSTTDQGTSSTGYMRQCIGAIVITSIRQPVPVQVLCELLRNSVKPVVVKAVIKRLGAVLYADGRLDGAIRVYHPSFIDFALDEQRSGEFWVDPVQRNVELSTGCVSVMKHELRFNICELETSHLLNSEVPGLESRVKSKISDQLGYSCTYWISHLLDGNDEDVASREAESVICGPRVLYWLEVLSLLQKADVAAHGLRELSTWLSDVYNSRDIWDAYRFAFAFFDPIAASAPHIYVSALPFSPTQSEIYHRLSPLFPNTAKVTRGEEVRWPAWLRSITHPDSVDSLCISRDSPLLVTGCRDGGVRVYNLRTGMLTLSVCVDPPTHRDLPGVAVAISPDGVLVACGTDNYVRIWEVNTGDTVASISVEEIIGNPRSVCYKAMSFSNTGAILRAITSTYLLSLDSDGTKLMADITWDMNSESTKVIKHAFPLLGLEQPDSKRAPDNIVLAPDLSCFAAFPLNNRRTILQPNLGAPAILSFGTESDGSVFPLAFSSDGSIFTSTRLDDMVHFVQFWDSRTGVSLGAVTTEHTRSLTSVGFSRDGNRIITGSQDRTVRMWDMETGCPISSPLLGHSGSVTFVGFSNDGTYAVSSSNEKAVLVWDASEGDFAPDDPSAVEVHPTSNSYEFVHHSSSTGPSCSVEAVGFSPDGTRIISGSSDEGSARDVAQVQFWDASTGGVISEPQYDWDGIQAIFDLAYSPDGSYITGKGFNHAYIWNTQTGSQKKFKINPHLIPSTLTDRYAFSSDGARLAISIVVIHPDSPEASQPKQVIIKDTSTGDIVGQFNAGVLGVWFIAFSPDDSRLYSYHLHSRDGGGKTGKMYIRDTQTYDGVEIWSRDENVEFWALSPDGGSLLGYTTPKTIHPSARDLITVHDIKTGDVTAGPFSTHEPIFIFPKFSPDGSLLAWGEEMGSIHLWDLKSGNATSIPLVGHTSRVESIAFSSDRTRLVSGSRDKTIRIWEVNPSIAEPWDSETTSSWPKSTYNFPPHPTHPDWVSHDRKSYTLWLPSQYRRTYDIRALQCISADPAVSPVHIDFSKFVHGTNWTSVRDEEALREYDLSK